MTLLVQPGRRALTGDGHDRRPIHVRIGKPGDEVGGSGPERCHAYTCPTGESTVNICHECGALLMASGDELDGAFEQRIHDVDVFFTRNAEDVFDPLVLEAAYHQLGSRFLR